MRRSVQQFGVRPGGEEQFWHQFTEFTASGKGRSQANRYADGAKPLSKRRLKRAAARRGSAPASLSPSPEDAVCNTNISRIRINSSLLSRTTRSHPTRFCPCSLLLRRGTSQYQLKTTQSAYKVNFSKSLQRTLEKSFVEPLEKQLAAAQAEADELRHKFRPHWRKTRDIRGVCKSKRDIASQHKALEHSEQICGQETACEARLQEVLKELTQTAQSEQRR